MTLFFSEMWERFCYYGMRVLLTLYLVKSLLNGDAEASLIYGAYTGLVYAAPILGGKLADNFLGYRYAVILGGILMAIGEFFILGGTQEFLLIGMGALIVGNGYFKANISTIVGKLYEDNDPRRDSGFTIFYIGINVGALLATTLVAYVGETYGFEKGFMLAGIGMLLGIFIFYSFRNTYEAAQGLGFTEKGKQKVFGPFNYVQVITVGSLSLIPLCYVLILNNGILNWIFLGLFLYIAFTMIKAGSDEDKRTGEKIWADRMKALIIFMVINIAFWACFEQAGTSLTLFADRSVNREIFGWVMPATMTQFFNPAFIIIFGSLFSVMWVKLSAIGKNPSIPMKFAFGILQLAAGFLLTYVGYMMSENNLVPLLILVFLYLLHTTGELFLSPIGLSMVTKLAPKKMAATAMGAWFLSFAIANLVGGQIAALTGGGHGGGGEEVEGFNAKTTVMEAAEETSVNFEDWVTLGDLPKNISYEKYQDIEDWIEIREGLNKDISFDDWKSNRAMNDPLESSSEWLNKDAWGALNTRYLAIVEKDEDKSSEPGMSIDDWMYYRGGFDEGEFEGQSVMAALDVQKDTVQKTRLDKYVSVFTTIGLVLVAIALIVAVLNNPIKKLMHGVE
ncbi:MAG: peptide MFS transporter [Bacteroidia bacterium]